MGSCPCPAENLGGGEWAGLSLAGSGELFHTCSMAVSLNPQTEFCDSCNNLLEFFADAECWGFPEKKSYRLLNQSRGSAPERESFALLTKLATDCGRPRHTCLAAASGTG